jgi:hypothetical protein
MALLTTDAFGYPSGAELVLGVKVCAASVSTPRIYARSATP